MEKQKEESTGRKVFLTVIIIAAGAGLIALFNMAFPAQYEWHGHGLDDLGVYLLIVAVLFLGYMFFSLIKGR